VNFDVFQIIGEFLGTDDGLTTVHGVREVLDGIATLLNDDLPDVGDFHAAVPYREVEGLVSTLDVIVPKGEGPFPVLVYLHGGAWVWGSPATHRKLTFRLAEQGFLILSVDYRLAPEHPFPSGFNDCVHAIHFAAHNAGQWGGDSDRLVLAGDSAGANLAAAAAIELAGRVAAPSIRAIGLMYGVFDFSGFESDGVTRLLVDAYLGGEEALVGDPRVSPIVSATKLPPAHIAVGSADPLIEDSQTLRATLARAGKVHDFHVYEDMPHAFMQMEFLTDARQGVRRMTDFLHSAVEP
jgi:acetyl esterase